MIKNHYKNNISHQEIRILCEDSLGSLETDVKSDATAWIVSNEQGDAAKKVVFKLLENDSTIQTASQMHSLHEKVRCKVDGEERTMVSIMDHSDDSNSIIMEFVDGFPLLKLLQRALFVGKGRAEAIHALQKVGEILADINAIKEEDVGLKTKARSNESYKEDLIKISQEIKMSGCLLNGHQDVVKFANSFSKVWKERSPKHLIAVDVQPKNVFLSENGIVLIDPGYVIGNPAMNIAQVLVSIDQLGMKFPLRGHIRIIEEWKKHFLLAYMQSKNAYEWAEEDLAFFYPWALLQSYIRHVSYRPILAKYFARWYGGKMSRFICSQRVQNPSSV